MQLSLDKQTEATFIFNEETDVFCPILKFYAGIFEDIMKIFSRLGGGDNALSGDLLGMLVPPLSIRILMLALYRHPQESPAEWKYTQGCSGPPLCSGVGILNGRSHTF